MFGLRYLLDLHTGQTSEAASVRDDAAGLRERLYNDLDKGDAPPASPWRICPRALAFDMADGCACACAGGFSVEAGQTVDLCLEEAGA
jgi:hypothetical protein